MQFRTLEERVRAFELDTELKIMQLDAEWKREQARALLSYAVADAHDAVAKVHADYLKLLKLLNYVYQG